MVLLKCKKCGNEWEYTGAKSVYATCPDCRSLVKIEKKGGEE
jgi:DNA-directed RNA polymerase subunit RPC12/RpoP